MNRSRFFSISFLTIQFRWQYYKTLLVYMYPKKRISSVFFDYEIHCISYLCTQMHWLKQRKSVEQTFYHKSMWTTFCVACDVAWFHHCILVYTVQCSFSHIYTNTCWSSAHIRRVLTHHGIEDSSLPLLQWWSTFLFLVHSSTFICYCCMSLHCLLYVASLHLVLSLFICLSSHLFVSMWLIVCVCVYCFSTVFSLSLSRFFVIFCCVFFFTCVCFFWIGTSFLVYFCQCTESKT